MKRQRGVRIDHRLRRSRPRSTADPRRSGSIWSCTARPSTWPGHNDVLAGVVAGPRIWSRWCAISRTCSARCCDPHAAFLVGRGLKTLALRVERQNATALPIARALENHPAVAQVFYPGLASHPDHAIARAADARLRRRRELRRQGRRRRRARSVVDGCKLARIAPSLGGVETLIEQPAIMSYFELSTEERAAIGIEDGLIRSRSASKSRATSSPISRTRSPPLCDGIDGIGRGITM